MSILSNLIIFTKKKFFLLLWIMEKIKLLRLTAEEESKWQNGRTFSLN